MKKKRKIITFLAMVGIVLCLSTVAACGGNTDSYKFPDYTYENPVYSEEDFVVDEGVTLDGKLDEDFWKTDGRKWLDVTKATDTSVSLRASSYIGEKGVYMAFDVDDPFIFCSEKRDMSHNSGIELYVSAHTDARGHAYEIDFNADGRAGAKIYTIRDQVSNNQLRVGCGATPKGGEINTLECSGYVIEAFLPNYLFGGSTPQFVYADVAVVSTLDIESETREWYPFAYKEYGGGWMDPISWFRFDTDGLMDCISVRVEGEHVALTGKSTRLKKHDCTVELVVDEGYAVTEVRCNGTPITDALTDTEKGVVYVAKAVEGDLTFTVTTEAITAGNKTLQGTAYLHKDKQKTVSANTELTLKKGNETVRTVTTGANGAFTVSDLPQGFYTVCGKIDGYADLAAAVMLNRDRSVNVLFEAESLFVGVADWDLTDENDRVLYAKGGSLLQFKKSQGDFILSARARITSEIEESLDETGRDFRYDIRALYDEPSGEFAGKFFAYSLYRTHTAGKAVWKIQIPNYGNNCVAENWLDEYFLTPTQIAYLQSEDGIAFAMARNGATFTFFLNGVPVASYSVEKAGAATAKVIPAFANIDDTKHPTKLLEYSFTTDLRVEDWYSGTVEVDADIRNGSISVNPTSSNNITQDTVTITATPEEGYVCTDIKINGISYGAEIRDNRVTVAFNSKVMRVTAKFVSESLVQEDKVVLFPNADGLQVRLTKGGTVVDGTEQTVADGKVTFLSLSLGWYTVQYNAFGVWLKASKEFLVDGEENREETCMIANASVYAKNEWKVTNTGVGTAVHADRFMIDATLEDCWFVTKISGLTGFSTGAVDTVGAGFYIDYSGEDFSKIAFRRKEGNQYREWDGWVVQQIGGDWHSGHVCDYDGLTEFDTLFGGDGLYLVVHRTKADGKIVAYAGSTLDSLKEIVEYTERENTDITVGLYLETDKGRNKCNATFSDTAIYTDGSVADNGNGGLAFTPTGI